ncbi:MAG: hypothetical protein Q8R02_18900 [Hyphomonadaceae bacterium]|nr:hypothetical protein [Hyphomonadaceae bacterium]
MPIKHAMAIVALAAALGLPPSTAQQAQSGDPPLTHCESTAIDAVERAQKHLDRATYDVSAYKSAKAFNNACVELNTALGIMTGLYHCDAELIDLVSRSVAKNRSAMEQFNPKAGTAYNCRSLF